VTKEFTFRGVSQILIHFKYVPTPISDFTGRSLYLFHCSLFNLTEKLNIPVAIGALKGGGCCMEEASSSCIIQGPAARIVLVFSVFMDLVEVTTVWTFPT